MKIKMLVSIAGNDFSYIPGQVVTVEDYIGEAWIEAGHAEAAKVGRPRKVINIKSPQKAKK